MSIQLPESGFVFYPVGNGDSTTVCVDNSTRIQVDINHLEKSTEDETPHWPVLDTLVDSLPLNTNKTPYLSVFALTHPDQDHCRGFTELLKKVTINEIWFTPRIFREYTKDLCDDAMAFKKEVQRRVQVIIRDNGAVSSGDRVRVIGYDELLKEDEFKDFPKELLSVPGTEITSIDGIVRTDFSAIIHSPFKDDAYAERNDASLGMRITLKYNDKSGRALLLGDLAYPTVKRILEKSKEQDLLWDVLLAPHHCSKKVMYWKDEGDDKESLRQEIMDEFESSKLSGAYVVASAESDFTDSDGDDPPHGKARNQYERIIDAGRFKCTQEWPKKEKPEPLVFKLDDAGISLLSESIEGVKGLSPLAAAVSVARGGDKPPQKQVGFGKLA